MDKSSHENYTNRSEVSLQSIKHPQQESGDQKLSAADEESLRRILLENPKILEELRQKLNEPAKAEVPSETRKRLQAIFGFFQRVACGCPSWVKAVLPYIWIRMLALFTMQLEFCKVNRTELDKLQNILKEVDETHAKVVEQVGEIEDKIKETRANDYKISSTENKDLEIQLITAERDLGNCEDGLSDLQEDIKRLKAVVRWRLFVQIIGIVFLAALAAVVLYHSANVPESSQSSSVPNVPRYSDKEEEERIRWNLHDRHQQHNHHQRHHHHYQNQQQYYPKSESSHDEEKGFTTAVFMMIAGCVAAVIGIPLKCMIESLYINSKLIAECEKVRKDNVRKAKHLQKKLKRTVEKELPQMRKHLIVLERDVSRYASLQKLNSD